MGAFGRDATGLYERVVHSSVAHIVLWVLLLTTFTTMVPYIPTVYLKTYKRDESLHVGILGGRDK